MPRVVLYSLFFVLCSMLMLPCLLFVVLPSFFLSSSCLVIHPYFVLCYLSHFLIPFYFLFIILFSFFFFLPCSLFFLPPSFFFLPHCSLFFLLKVGVKNGILSFEQFYELVELVNQVSIALDGDEELIGESFPLFLLCSLLFALCSLFLLCFC